MKRIIILIPLLLGIFVNSSEAKTIYGRNIDVNVFFSSLEPYGEWIEIGYNDYVWRPYKSDYDWRPYSVGRWEWTRNGWYWVSYEPFGWATFHYGRWYFDDYYGWVWMPDNVWAPSWVEWRYDDYYIGWAPLPPYALFNRNRGIHFSINWHSGYFYWNFVKYHHFVSHEIHHHFMNRDYVKNVFKRTKYRTNYFSDNDRIVNGGVSRRFVERKIGRKLTTRQINRTEDIKQNDSRKLMSSRGIIEYTPSEKVSRNSGFDKKTIKKGRELKSLKTDKIVLNNRGSAISERTDRQGNIRKPEAENSQREINTNRNNNELKKRSEAEDRNPKNNSIRKNVEKNRDIVNNESRTKKYSGKTDTKKEYRIPSNNEKKSVEKKSTYEYKKKSSSSDNRRNTNFSRTPVTTKKVETKKSRSESKDTISRNNQKKENTVRKNSVDKSRSRS